MTDPDSRVPIAIETAGDGENFAVLYGGTPTRQVDGGGDPDSSYHTTETPDGETRVVVSTTQRGVAAVSTIPFDPPTEETRYVPHDEQPDDGTRWEADGEPDVEIIPTSEVPIDE